MTTIPDKSLVAILDLLDKGNIRVAQQFPGDSPARQNRSLKLFSH